MRTRSTRMAWFMLAVFAVGYAAAPLSILNGNFQREPGFYLAMVSAFTAFMVVGAVIVAHRPGNAVGWIFSAVGLLSAAGVLGMEYAEYAYVTRPGSLPGAVVGASIHWFWYPLLGLILVFTPLLFPTGRLLSARWRPVAVLAAVGIAALTVLVALQPTIRLQNKNYIVRNPLGLAGVPNPEEGGAVGTVLTGLLFGCIAAAVASVVLRFRRARGAERQQLKWFTYAAALMVVSFLLSGFLLPAVWVTDVVFGLSIALVPVAAGIAILRYRLYAIDRLINRTLVYGLLTALLGGTYAIVVLVLGQLFGGINTQPPSWAVAGATLAVAALFQPARRRIQAVVDRRFNRGKYDAAKTVEAFSRRLREEVDLDALSAELLAVVDQTMQPTNASLWLRPSMERMRPTGV